MIRPGALARFTPWLSQPLAHAAKDEEFRKRLNYRAESALMGRSALVAGWAVGAAGFFALMFSMWEWHNFLPLARTVEKMITVDQTTGIISEPVSLKDAAITMPEAADRENIQRYMEICLGWVPELDKTYDYRCKLMSRPDQQTRYNAWRKTPDSPINAIGPGGLVQLENFRFHKEPWVGITRSYRVQYDRHVWKGLQKETVEGWTAIVDFQWHPELPMTEADRRLNRGGFQAIAFTPNPDTPSQRRQ